MTINELVMETLKEVDFKKILKENLKKNIEKSIEEAIKSVYGSPYGDFYDKLKKILQKDLSINLEVVNIPQYNTLIQQAIESEFKTNAENLSKQNIKQLIDNLAIGELKEEYNFSELLKEFKNSRENFNENSQMSLHIDFSYSGLIFIYFDEEEDIENYNCRYRLVLNEKKIITSLTTNENSAKFILSRDNFDNLLSNIFLQGKKINLDYGTDKDDYDLEYEREKEEWE